MYYTSIKYFSVQQRSSAQSLSAAGSWQQQQAGWQAAERQQEGQQAPARAGNLSVIKGSEGIKGFRALVPFLIPTSCLMIVQADGA